MLEWQDEISRGQLEEHIARLECRVELPESWTEHIGTAGPKRAHLPDSRRFPRWHNCVSAGLYVRQTFPVIPRVGQWHPIYLTDISRGGLAFLYFEQLYPLERLRVLLLDKISLRLLQTDHIRDIEVVRCRFVQANCFEVGAKFVTT
jgi:hypothetical protein